MGCVWVWVVFRKIKRAATLQCIQGERLRPKDLTMHKYIITTNNFSQEGLDLLILIDWVYMIDELLRPRLAPYTKDIYQSPTVGVHKLYSQYTNSARTRQRLNRSYLV